MGAPQGHVMQFNKCICWAGVQLWCVLRLSKTSRPVQNSTTNVHLSTVTCLFICQIVKGIQIDEKYILFHNFIHYCSAVVNILV